MGFSREIRSYLAVVAAALLVLVAIHALSRPRGVHLTAAELLVQPSLGYTPPSLVAARRAIPGDWSAISLPHAPLPSINTAADGAEPPTAISWYAFHLPQGGARPHDLYLYIPRWKTDGTIAVYVDGRLQYQSHANLQWNGSNQPLWIAFPDTAEASPPHEILIRMQHVRGIGGALSTLWVGSYSDLAATYMVRHFFQADLPYLSTWAFLAAGVFALIVWMKGGRRQILYLLFFTVTLVAFVRGMHNYMGLDRLPISDAWFGWLTVNAVPWLILNIHLFVQRIHSHRTPVLTGAVVALTIALGVATLPQPWGLLDATLMAPILYPAMLVMAFAVAGFGFYWSWRANSLEGFALSAWGSLMTLAGVYDWLLQNNLIDIENLFLSVYAQTAIIFAFCHIILRQYTLATERVEQANVVLAERLAARESELVASHEKLRAIERRELIHEERQRLMQDMHDGLGSSLVSALRVVEHGHTDEMDVAQLLKGCIDDLKLTIDSMEPVETDLLLLLGTLRFRLQPRLEATGVMLRWEVRDVPPLPWLDQRRSLHILRILQEAFTNAVKHADASEIVVTTDLIDGEIHVGITDNGRGFDPEHVLPGRGLNNQSRRAEVLGGRLELCSGPGGTAFQLILPVAMAI